MNDAIMNATEQIEYRQALAFAERAVAAALNVRDAVQLKLHTDRQTHSMIWQECVEIQNAINEIKEYIR